MRALALTYVTGMTPRPEHSAVCFNLIPGVGEYFVFPALTTTGPCEIMVFEGVPGGPMDCWEDVRRPDQHLAKSKEILDTFLPWEAERCRDIELTDDNGILAGRFPPTVRKPIGTLPSGAKVLGLGDAVCLNDPITGQGSNNASKAATVYLKRILAHGDRPFDAAWMQEHVRRLLGLRAVGGGLDQHDAGPAAALRARDRWGRPRRTRGWRTGWPTASTTRATSSRGSPTPRPRRPT